MLKLLDEVTVAPLMEGNVIVPIQIVEVNRLPSTNLLEEDVIIQVE